jgi:hypothetical protein
VRALEQLATDAYARAALPVLMHRINNATQVLAGLNALLKLGAAPGLLEQRAQDLGQVARTYADSGWLIAVLGSALGAETLLERREQGGLEAVLELAVELARREQRELVIHGRPPRLRPEAGGGWEAAWALGTWLHAASALSAPKVEVRLEHGGSGLELHDDAAWDAQRAAAGARIASRVVDVSVAPGHLGLGARWCF